ncbi:MAG: TspO/MBR family protein [Chitinophagaceae bacterium]
MNNLVKAIISIAIPLGIGVLGSLFTTPEIDGWFRTLQKPSWNPPDWIFGPVWTLLYVLMGIAFFLVWKAERQTGKSTAFCLYVIQLVLNLGWSFVFFNRHEIGWALAEIAVLWLFILLTIFSFARFHKAAAWLLVPYISWVSFAAILNYTIWQLNR